MVPGGDFFLFKIKLVCGPCILLFSGLRVDVIDNRRIHTFIVVKGGGLGLVPVVVGLVENLGSTPRHLANQRIPVHVQRDACGTMP